MRTVRFLRSIATAAHQEMGMSQTGILEMAMQVQVTPEMAAL
ncbi:MAG: hypothetical protein ACKOEO_06435 [Planctomycetaceae bacterium]